MQREAAHTRVVTPFRTQPQHRIAIYDIKIARLLHRLEHRSLRDRFVNFQGKRRPHEVDYWTGII
jgi:hypothetical protein